MASDFVQMRWQQIRGMESQLETEKENIELRKKLAGADKNSAAEEKLAEYKSKVKLQLESICGMVASLRGEAEIIRNSSCKQQLEVSMTVDRIQRILIQYAVKDEGNELDKSRLLNDHELMAMELALAQKAARLAEEESQGLASKLAKSKEEVEEVIHAKSLLMQNCTMLKEQADTLTVQLQEVDSNYSASQLECVRLKRKVTKLEALNGDAMALGVTLEEYKQRCASQDEVIYELKDETSTQQVQIANMQLHIERLTNAIMGNKSHFAKFVELKNENVTLQHKLDAKNAPSSKVKRDTPLGLTTSQTAPAGTQREAKSGRGPMHAPSPTPPASGRGEGNSFQSAMAQQTQQKNAPKKGRPPAEYNNHDYSSSQAQAVGIDRGRGPRVKKDMQSEPRPIQCHESYQNQLAMQNAAATPTSHAANGLPSISPSKSYNVNDGNASTDVYLNRSKNLPSQKRLLAQAAAVQGNLIVDPEVEPQLLADLSLAQLHQQALATTSPSKLLEQYSQQPDFSNTGGSHHFRQMDRQGSPNAAASVTSHASQSGGTLVYSPRSYKPNMPQYTLQHEDSSRPSNIQYSHSKEYLGYGDGVDIKESRALPSTLPALNKSGTFANRERKVVQNRMEVAVEENSAGQRKIMI